MVFRKVCCSTATITGTTGRRGTATERVLARGTHALPGVLEFHSDTTRRGTAGTAGTVGMAGGGMRRGIPSDGTHIITVPFTDGDGPTHTTAFRVTGSGAPVTGFIAPTIMSSTTTEPLPGFPHTVSE